VSPAPLVPGEWTASEERAAIDYLYDHHRDHVLRTTRDWAHTEAVLWALNKGGFLRPPRDPAWCEKCDRVMPASGSPVCIACGSESPTGGESALQ
jgi:hypothetical protein